MHKIILSNCQCDRHCHNDNYQGARTNDWVFLWKSCRKNNT